MVVTLVSHQRDRNDKFRIRGAAFAVDLQHVLQYPNAHLYDQRRWCDFASVTDNKGSNAGIRLRNKFIDHQHHLSRDRESGMSIHLRKISHH